MCLCEWPGRLKCLATGLDRSDPLFLTSSKCSRKRSREIFKQINGVAMGTKMGPNYANLFAGYVEEQIFNQFDSPKPELFGRYIDDCLGATSCTKEELEQFIGFVNSFHPALKFTWEISETSVTFLDINISVQDNKLATSVHYKPTDSHSYLLYSSSHPSHFKDSIPCSQFLRLRRLCSEDSDFNSKCTSTSQGHFCYKYVSI